LARIPAHGGSLTYVEILIEDLETFDAINPFFEGWMVAWSRKIFIAKVLGSVKPESNPAQLRDRLRRLQRETRGGLRRIEGAAGKADLERAVLAIDPFPRCALLLYVFERLAVEDVATLLNSDRESVQTAASIGLTELARNLAEGRNFPEANEVKGGLKE
jgi:hypothetical protein